MGPGRLGPASVFVRTKKTAGKSWSARYTMDFCNVRYPYLCNIDQHFFLYNSGPARHDSRDRHGQMEETLHISKYMQGCSPGEWQDDFGQRVA
jgi:hypothetical protein